MLGIAAGIISVICDGMRWLWLALRSRSAVEAENLFLRRQLALYIGVSSRRTRLLVGESPTEAKRPRPRSVGGIVARKQDDGALRQHTLEGACARHQVATYSERRSSLVKRSFPVAETVDYV
jgi:hypothetical protein